MFPQHIPPESYWNYMMIPSLMNGPAMIPRPTTQVDQLKAFLSLAKPPSSGAPLAPKRTAHSVLKPPLYVSREWKQIGPGMFVKEVTDPTVPENDELRTYMMCGECESKKLYRKIPSILKHRQLSHFGASAVEDEETQPIGPGYPDQDFNNIDQLVLAARSTLESLSLDELRNELGKIHVPLGVEHLSKRQLIDKYISRIVGTDIFELTNPVSHASVCDVSEYSADQPPLPETDDLGILRSIKIKAQTIIERFPTISRGILTAALVADLTPLEDVKALQQMVSVGVDTGTSTSSDNSNAEQTAPETKAAEKSKCKSGKSAKRERKQQQKDKPSGPNKPKPDSKEDKKRKTDETEKSKGQKDKSSSKKAKGEEDEESERRSSRLASHSKKE